MATGSKKRYALDLNDIMTFPDDQNMPVFPPKEGESWVMLMEITRDQSVFRPVYAVKDKTGARYVVAMYTPDPVNDARELNFQVGHTVCMTGVLPCRFLDGQAGFKIEDPNVIEVLPVSLKELWALNTGLRARNDGGLLLKCNVCNNGGTKRCGACGCRYCSRECQKSDWRDHKRKCKAMKSLHQWNRTDWG